MVVLWATITGIAISQAWLPPTKVQSILDFNVSLTMAFIPLFLWRIWHRLLGQKSTQDRTHTQQHPIWVRAFHGLLYLLTLVVLCSGVSMMPHDINVFELISLPYIVEEPAYQAFFYQLHKYTSFALGLAVILHVAAVLWHSLKGRSVLHRMC